MYYWLSLMRCTPAEKGSVILNLIDTARRWVENGESHVREWGEFCEVYLTTACFNSIGVTCNSVYLKAQRYLAFWRSELAKLMQHDLGSWLRVLQICSTEMGRKQRNPNWRQVCQSMSLSLKGARATLLPPERMLLMWTSCRQRRKAPLTFSFQSGKVIPWRIYTKSKQPQWQKSQNKTKQKTRIPWEAETTFKCQIIRSMVITQNALRRESYAVTQDKWLLAAMPSPCPPHAHPMPTPGPPEPLHEEQN